MEFFHSLEAEGKRKKRIKDFYKALAYARGGMSLPLSEIGKTARNNVQMHMEKLIASILSPWLR